MTVLEKQKHFMLQLLKLKYDIDLTDVTKSFGLRRALFDEYARVFNQLQAISSNIMIDRGERLEQELLAEI